jgi:hypothetical protein
MPKKTSTPLPLPGLKGWLLAIVIAMAVSTLALVFVPYLLFTSYQESAKLTGDTLPGLLALSWFEAIGTIALSSASIVWVMVAMRKKKIAIHLFIVLNMIGAVYAIVDVILGIVWARTEGYQFFVTEYTSAVEAGYIISLSLTLPAAIALHYYFKKSQRVQLTFVK